MKFGLHIVQTVEREGVGTFPIHFGYQIQLTEGLSFVPKDPTWAPSMRLSCWRLWMNRLLILCLLPCLNSRSFFAAVLSTAGPTGPFQTLEYRCFRSLQRPQAGPLKLSPLRSHSETAASLMF